jgi:hypothetical protein
MTRVSARGPARLTAGHSPSRLSLFCQRSGKLMSFSKRALNCARWCVRCIPRIFLERQHLPQPVQGRLRHHRCHHRFALEWSQVFRPARSSTRGGLIVKNGTTKSVRCAIYTRVSTDHGLEQNGPHAQLHARPEGQRPELGCEPRNHEFGAVSQLRCSLLLHGYWNGDVRQPCAPSHAIR